MKSQSGLPSKHAGMLSEKGIFAATPSQFFNCELAEVFAHFFRARSPPPQESQAWRFEFRIPETILRFIATLRNSWRDLASRLTLGCGARYLTTPCKYYVNSCCR